MAQSAALPGNVDLYLHIRVLVAIILGLSVTRLVSGVAALIQHPGRYPIWSVHLGWVAWALVNVVTFWWWEFRLSFVQQWTFVLYAFVCVYASMYYFLSALLSLRTSMNIRVIRTTFFPAAAGSLALWR